MPFQLVYGDHELSLRIPFESHVEDRLVELLERSDPDDTNSRTRNELAGRIAEAIGVMLTDNVLPPTDKQVKYAVAIARELGLQLAPEVLRSREAMTSFLGAHADTYRRRKAL